MIEERTPMTYWIVIDRDNLAVGEKIEKLPQGTDLFHAIRMTEVRGSDARLLEEVPIASQTAQGDSPTFTEVLGASYRV